MSEKYSTGKIILLGMVLVKIIALLNTKCGSENILVIAK